MNAYKESLVSPHLPLSVVQALVSGWLLELDEHSRFFWVQGPPQVTNLPAEWQEWTGKHAQDVWPEEACATLYHALTEAAKEGEGTPLKSYSVTLPLLTTNEQAAFFSLSVIQLSRKFKQGKQRFLVWIRSPHTNHHELVQMAFFDPLTGLPNRRLLHDRINQALHAASRIKQWGAVLFLDLDGFKQVNDHWGHAAGDDLLRQVAQRLTGAVRKTDTVARLGGDEFVVLLHHLGTSDSAAVRGVQRVMTYLLQQLAGQAFKWHRETTYLSASIGAALFNSNTASSLCVDELLHHADQAMYQAKAAGKNTGRLSLVPMPTFDSQNFIQNQTDGP